MFGLRINKVGTLSISHGTLFPLIKGDLRYCHLHENRALHPENYLRYHCTDSHMPQFGTHLITFFPQIYCLSNNYQTATQNNSAT